MIHTKLFLLVAFVFAVFCASSPLAGEPLFALEPRAKGKGAKTKAKGKGKGAHSKAGGGGAGADDDDGKKCRALRNGGTPSEQRFFETDEPSVHARDEAALQLMERAAGANCDVRGHVVNAPTPTYVQNNVSRRVCANWCLCTLGQKYCKSFLFTPNENPEITGRGTCSAYNVGAGQLDVQPGGNGSVYGRKCFHKSSPTKPSPPMTTKKQNVAAPTAASKRDDAFGDIVAKALAGL